MFSKLRWLVMVVGLFAALGSVQAKRVAVLFGTNYTGNSAGIPPLELCEKDAALMEKTLKSHGRFDNVKVYLGRMVTANNVENAIEEVADETDEDDTVVFYFSGHGTYQRNKDAPDGLDNVIVMFNRPHISELQLNEWLEDVESTKTVFVFDCCHAGGIGRQNKKQRGTGDVPVGDGSSGIVLQNRNASRYFDNKVVVASSDANETSIEIRGGINHGIFTYYFAQALNPANGDLNKDRTVTIFEAFEWTSKRVTNSAKKYNHKQTPQLIGDGSGIQIAGEFKPAPPAPQPGPEVVDPQPNPNPSPVGPPPNPVDPVDPVGPTEPEVVNHGEQGQIILATTILKSKYAVSSMNPNDIIGENDPHAIIGETSPYKRKPGEGKDRKQRKDEDRLVKAIVSGEEFPVKLQWVNEYQLRQITGEQIPLGVYSFNGVVKRNQVALITISRVPAGVHEVVIEADGYPVLKRRVGVEKNQVSKELVVASITGRGSIEGKVFYKNFEQPMAGHEIWMPTVTGVNQIHKFKTLSDGSFWFLNLPASANYQLMVSFLENSPIENNRFEVRPGGITKLDVVLSRKSVRDR